MSRDVKIAAHEISQKFLVILTKRRKVAIFY